MEGGRAVGRRLPKGEGFDRPRVVVGSVQDVVLHGEAATDTSRVV